MKPTKGCEPQDVEEFEKELKEAYFLLHEVSDVIIYGRTYGTHKHANVIRKVINNVVIPEEEVNELLKLLKVKKLWVGTPYIKERTLEEVEYWKSLGYIIVGYDGLGKVRGIDISNTPIFTIYRLVKKHLNEVREADAVYIACTALSTYEAVQYLHEDLEIPVISENVGAMWGALRRVKVKAKLPGFQL